MERLLRVRLVAGVVSHDRLDVVQRRDPEARDVMEQRLDILAVEQTAQFGNGVEHLRIDGEAAGDRIALPHFPRLALVAEDRAAQRRELLRRDRVLDCDEAVPVESLAPVCPHFAREPPPSPGTKRAGRPHPRTVQSPSVQTL